VVPIDVMGEALLRILGPDRVLSGRESAGG
jgi:hypothetical protein